MKSTPVNDLLTDFVKFLCTRPTPEQIRAWHPTTAVQERISDLLWRNGEDLLTADEKQELETALDHELFLRGVKARVMENLVTRS